MNKLLLFVVIFGFISIFSIEPGVNSLNISNSNNLTNNTNQEAKIYLKLDWNDNRIVNGQEFNIKVNAFNLKNRNYDVKLYIYESDKNTPISQTRDQNFKWISSSLYVKDFFSGPGNESDSIKLRINEKNNALEGGATIVARIRESRTSYYIEEQEDIFIYKSKSLNQKTTDNNLDRDLESNDNLNQAYEESSIIGEAIKLGANKETETIKTQNNIVYESKNEIIKKYSIYWFIILIIIFLILLTLRLV